MGTGRAVTAGLSEQCRPAPLWLETSLDGARVGPTATFGMDWLPGVRGASTAAAANDLGAGARYDR
jgi:hypothetical protein